jgi:hypothetical protein
VQWLSISEFDSEDVGSNPAPIAKNVGFSLIGKASVCATEEQGSNPGVNQQTLSAVENPDSGFL